MASASSSSSKLCFNSDCKELRPERPKKGWRLRSGELAELCDRCGLVILPLHCFVDSHSVLFEFFYETKIPICFFFYFLKIIIFYFCVSVYFFEFGFWSKLHVAVVKEIGIIIS